MTILTIMFQLHDIHCNVAINPQRLLQLQIKTGAEAPVLIAE